LIDIEQSATALGEPTQAYWRALLVYIIIPLRVLDAILYNLLNLEEESFSKKLNDLSKNFE
jgi:hypothetical protein